MNILAQRDLLSDGLTPCMKVEVDGDVFFLLRDESGRLAGWKDLGYVRTFQHKEHVGDTVEVIQPNRIELESPERNGTIRLLKADRLIRYFEDGGAWYVRRLGARPSYGWAVLPTNGQGTTWKIVRSAAVPIVLSQMLRGRIVARINAINETFVQVYRVLGKETGKSIPVPRWSVDSGGTVLSCVLQPATAVRFYPKTIDELAAELQAYVVGTGYTVSTADNRIEFRRE